MGNVLGVEGVSPRSHEVDFESGLEGEFVFDYVLNEVGDVRIEGELAEYFSVDKEIIVGREALTVFMKLPDSLEGFGSNVVRFLVGDVVGIVKVNVAYPERFVDLRPSVGDVNVGEEILVVLKVSNLGSVGLNVSPQIEVYYGEDVVEVFRGEERWLEESGSLNYEFLLEGDNYSVGSYSVVTSVGSTFGHDSGEPEFSGRDLFSVGEFGLKILNYTEEVLSNGLRLFEVEVENLGDDRLKEVWAEVRIIGQLKEDGVSVSRVGGFDSSIISLAAWEKKVLVGYFDTRGFEGEVMLSVDVNYDGSVESEVVRVEVLKNWFWSSADMILVNRFWVGGVLGLVVLVLIWWWFRNRYK